MLDIKNAVVSHLDTSRPAMNRFVRMKNQLDTKTAAYLRYLGTKNFVNRASDYHYLVLAVTDSTAPVNGIDYIHPTVKPVVDYATAVISKGLLPNGEFAIEFAPEHEGDADAAQQATDMVMKILNCYNDPHQICQHWIMDAAMHKNGMLMVLPVREQITRYVTTGGNLDQLRAFEQQAAAAGLEVRRESRRRTGIDTAAVIAELQARQAELPEQQQMQSESAILAALDARRNGDLDLEVEEVNVEVEQAPDMIAEAMRRHTQYQARYRLTGYSLNIRVKHIPQHYWICDPTVIGVRDQPFCGWYDTMSIQEVQESYPDVDLDLFRQYAEYNQNGAYQAGSVLNNLAIHARDSVPIQGIPVDQGTAADPDSRQVTILTVWNRTDIDGDGEMELVEVIFSGQYVISAREVEFIPVANMCPKPLPGNFFGMSIAESVVPMQEYATAAARAEIQLGLLTATPRIGVKPDRVDFEQLMDGESAIFVLDAKFDPSTDVYPLPPPSGNLAFLEQSMNRIQQDVMGMVGMTTPQDVFNPEVMAPGNSGAKLQLALSPNQIIQDNTVKNCADGVKELVYLVWRTLIQYGDDYGVRKLAQEYHPEGLPVFMDYENWDDMQIADRKQIHVDLAVGMLSTENAIARTQLIQKAQQDFYATITGMVQANTLNREVFAKIRRPFQDMLRTLNVKDPDSYLPTEREVMAMIAQAQSQPAPEPDADEQYRLSQAELNRARTAEILSAMDGTNADTMLEFMSMAQGEPKVYNN